jgi:hypothetical protein
MEIVGAILYPVVSDVAHRAALVLARTSISPRCRRVVATRRASKPLGPHPGESKTDLAWLAEVEVLPEIRSAHPRVR